MNDIKKFMVEFKKDDVIFAEGDMGDEMYFIESGKVKIVKQIKKNQKVLAVLKRGDFFGEMAILTGKPRTASAIAMTDVTLLKIKSDFFEDFLRKNVEVAIKLVKKMAERLRETDILLEMANYKDETTRIVMALYQLAKESGKDKEIVVDPVELHSRSFTTTEILKSILKDLTFKKIILVEEKKIIVPSLDKLEKYANFLQLKDEFSFIEDGG